MILIIGMVAVSCSEKKINVDAIYTHATVYTVDNEFSIAECFAVDKGIIVAVGTAAEIQKKYTSQNIVDLAQKFVYPGFTDAHCHFTGYAKNLYKSADLMGTTSFDQIIEILKKFSSQNSREWVEGRGWDQNLWQVKEFPSNERLDSLFPNQPVLLLRIDGHAALANSEALHRAGISAATQVEGGSVMLKNGKPTGVLIDNAIELVSKIIPNLTEQQLSEALLKAQANCFAVGLTTVHDAGLDKNEILLIDTMHKTNQLAMRINAWLNPTDENFDFFVRKGVYKTERLTVSSIKIYADGALGSRGAKLLQPYTDDAQNTGLIMQPIAFYDSICALAYQHNYQVNTHAIGDSAVRLVLHTYSKYLKEKNDRRWRIEHSQVVNSEDFKFFADFSIIPSVQTTHATSDMYWAATRLGNDRVKGAYAYQQLLQQNGWLPNGSDFPVEHINPLFGFYAAVARKDQKGYPENGFQPENALSREQALRAMTIWAAKAAFEDKIKGSIEVGKFADFVVTDQDLMKTPESELFKIQVIKTFIGSKEVFSK